MEIKEIKDSLKEVQVIREQYNNLYDAPEEIASEADHIFRNEVRCHHI